TDLTTGDYRGSGLVQRQLWNVADQGGAYSALILAPRITLPHFSISSAISFPKSAGEPGSTAPPRSSNRDSTWDGVTITIHKLCVIG
ncbi:MAG TPA: hypothetical protein VJ255_09935, partial [Candidatus Acidoferrum sp.]|nr:hypothetical protein [Candidatus Acidoferrum sp.]